MRVLKKVRNNEKILYLQIKYYIVRATIPFLEQRFAEYNELMFDARLPQVKLRLSRARTYMGQLKWQRSRGNTLFSQVRKLVRLPLGHHAAPTDITLSISTLFDLPQAEIEDTLLHEMIHLHILVNRLRDTSSHGTLFRAKMREINERFGRHITISHRLTEQEREQDVRQRRHFVAVSHLRDGRVGVTVTTPSGIAMLWQRLPLLPEVLSTQWYLSTNIYFNRFRRSRTVKVYLADPVALRQHLADALPLVRENGRIFVRRKD